jgi:hypothetical protein
MIATTKLLLVGPMARRLRVPVKWLRAEAEAGRIPHLKADKVLLFDAETVERVLVERARQKSDTGGTADVA